MSTKRRHSPSPSSPSSPPPTAPSQDLDQPIFTSAPITDRSSTFIAHFSPTHSAKALQSSPAFSSAMHRIAAWRKPSPQQPLLAATSARPIYTSGYDDDGEKYAGKKLLRVLEEMDVRRGTVVCARWYGGILLGPVRFQHIERCAREAISKWRESLRGDEIEERAKKRKVEEEGGNSAEEKKRLVAELEERDRSIGVLRGLLAEKRAEKSKWQVNDEPRQGEEVASLGGEKTEGSATLPATEASSPKIINYGAMSLAALRRIDKARDKTIAWLLKEIDQAEIESGMAELDEALLRKEEEEEGKGEGEGEGQEARGDANAAITTSNGFSGENG